MHTVKRTEMTSDSERLDFGYSWVWTYGHLALVVPLVAAAGIARLAGAPAWIAAALLVPAAWAFAGFVVMRFIVRIDELAEIPTADYLAEGKGRVLDLGCGAGRTSIMVAQARPDAQVTALDNFSAPYIKDHNEGHLARNLRLAGVSERITIQKGDMLDLPFDDGTFDALVSSAAIDHLGPDIPVALAEANRVLRPGGEFLLMVIVPNVWMAIASGFLFAHILGRMPSRRAWRRMLPAAGFTLGAEGSYRGIAWFLAGRPEPASTRAEPTAASER